MAEDPKTVDRGRLFEWSAWAYLALAVIAVVWLGTRDGAIGMALFVDPESWFVDLGAGAVAAVFLVAGWQLALRTLTSARAVEVKLAEVLGPMGTAEIVTLALLSGFAEELFFRGAVQSQFGWFFATAVFGLLHVGPGREYRLWTAFAVVAGALLGGLTLWRGNLLAPITAHVAVNLVGLVRLRKLTPGAAEESV